MADWKKICCALDFSASSRIVLEKATGLARCLQAELTLVHVYQAHAPSPEIELEKFERATLELERKMAGYQQEAERVVGAPVRTIVLADGAPAGEIVRFARDGGFDLIVMGTHGDTGLTRVVLGSVADRVVREAACPVLVVRQVR